MASYISNTGVETGATEGRYIAMRRDMVVYVSWRLMYLDYGSKHVWHPLKEKVFGHMYIMSKDFAPIGADDFLLDILFETLSPPPLPRLRPNGDCHILINFAVEA